MGKILKNRERAGKESGDETGKVPKSGKMEINRKDGLKEREKMQKSGPKIGKRNEKGKNKK
jgi:hypothetical protein